LGRARPLRAHGLGDGGPDQAAHGRAEEDLDKPVDVWRKELNIEPIRHGQNSWYELLAGLDL
jgi:hypothetical protein